jgi:hypothetical protein
MLSVVVETVHRIVVYTSHALLILSLGTSIAYSLGWIHRLLWYLAEKECSKLLNNTTVTFGSLRLDLLRGRAWASNVVIHAPQREQWKWESPIFARVGKVYVETNLVLCLLSLWFLWEEQPLDIYTIHVSDIQCFVERKQTFFNFFLLDPHVELPDPRELVEEENLVEGGEQDSQCDPTPPCDSEAHNLESPSWDMNNDTTSPAEEKAHKLMGDMFRALSRAAKEGSLQGALVEHRQTITRELKALQSTKKSDAMLEGVKIVQHVSKAVVEKTKTVPQVVRPTRRVLKNEKIVPVRIGRILVQDARIFTRDHWEATSSDGVLSLSRPVAKTQSCWNKPIVIHRVAVRASELCPPLSATDENNLPALYQTMDKVIEVVWKRVLAEGAKSNTGRLFKTAMMEVLEYWMEAPDIVTGSPEA